MTHEDMQKLAAEVATILGATYTPDPEDTWRARVAMPDGLELVFSTWSKKTGEIWAYVYRDKRRESAKCGEIGVAFARGAQAVAAEIKRRLLPEAAKKAEAARAKWAERDSAAGDLRLFCDELNRLPHMSAKIRNEGSDGQHIAFRFYQAETGAVYGEASAHGSVTVSRIFFSSPDPKGQLIRVLTAMRAGGN